MSAPELLEDKITCSHELKMFAHDREGRLLAPQTYVREMKIFDHELRGLGHDREHGL